MFFDTDFQITFTVLNVTFHVIQCISRLFYNISVRHFFHEETDNADSLVFGQLLQTMI